MKIVDPEALKAELSGLYADLSKHSAYQSIPDFVARTIDYQVRIDEQWRGDRVRLDYILPLLADPALRQWGDFGANTGFFSLSLAHDFPERQVLAIEANPRHADFIRRIGEVFELANLQVIGRPVAIDDLNTIPRQDVLLHLNVLHHAGADFDRGKVTGPDDFPAYAADYLERLHACTRTLVFQVGTNLWGDKTKPVIDHADDAGKLDLLAGLLSRSGWRIDDVAYATRRGAGPIHYEPLPGIDGATTLRAADFAGVLQEFDLPSHVGEFYRRPLFTCSSPS